MLGIFCSRKLANSNYEKKTFKYSHLRKKLPKKIDYFTELTIRPRNTNIHDANFIILKI